MSIWREATQMTKSFLSGTEQSRGEGLDVGVETNDRGDTSYLQALAKPGVLGN
jgi:hypothetical protein